MAVLTLLLQMVERSIPIVSFIARRQDLRELVGEHIPGAEQLGFADVLNWWHACSCKHDLQRCSEFRL